MAARHEPVIWKPAKLPLHVRAIRWLRRRAMAPVWRYELAAFGSRSDIKRPYLVLGGESIGIGARVWVDGGSRIEAHNSQRGTERILIGDDTYIGPHCHITAAKSVKIGRGVLIASRVYITDHDHDFSNPLEQMRSHRRLLVAPVIIHDNAWLGEGVMILKGVEIGANSVIGAGSVVTKPVPANSVAVGNPARVIRYYDVEQRQWNGVG